MIQSKRRYLCDGLGSTVVIFQHGFVKFDELAVGVKGEIPKNYEKRIVKLEGAVQVTWCTKTLLVRASQFGYRTQQIIRDLKIYDGNFQGKRHLKISLCFNIILSRLFYLVHFLQFGRSIVKINWYEQLQS